MAMDLVAPKVHIIVNGANEDYHWCQWRSPFVRLRVYPHLLDHWSDKMIRADNNWQQCWHWRQCYHCRHWLPSVPSTFVGYLNLHIAAKWRQWNHLPGTIYLAPLITTGDRHRRQCWSSLAPMAMGYTICIGIIKSITIGANGSPLAPFLSPLAYISGETLGFVAPLLANLPPSQTQSTQIA